MWKKWKSPETENKTGKKKNHHLKKVFFLTWKLFFFKAIQKGNIEGARIHAENAIREKNQGLEYLRLASRIDAVASRIESAVRMKAVTETMGGVVKGMGKALKSMDVQQVKRN